MAMAEILDGKQLARTIRAELKEKVAELKSSGITPGLALLLVGDNPASQVYVRSKAKACAEVGIFSIVEKRPAETTQEEVLELIARWNADPRIHGILVQLPLPSHIDEQAVLLAIDPRKDVDGFHPENMGRLVEGLPGFVPCTPAGIIEILRRYNISTVGKHAVVLGRSNIVGKPIANLLYQKSAYANATVTICHTATQDLAQYTRSADILIVAAGRPQLITGDYVREGVVVIDVGINRIEDPSAPKGYRLVGDVDFDSVAPKAAAITPVPGGVGPMTIAMLLTNTLRAATGEAFSTRQFD